MEKIRTYAVGSGEITLTEFDAEELRYILQMEHLTKVVTDIVNDNKSWLSFDTPSAHRHFIEDIVARNTDCINYDSAYFEEMITENIQRLADQYHLVR